MQHIITRLFTEAIVTKYLPPTDTRWARVKVTAPCGKSKCFAWDYSKHANENHATAARWAVAYYGHNPEEFHIVSIWNKDKQYHAVFKGVCFE